MIIYIAALIEIYGNEIVKQTRKQFCPSFADNFDDDDDGLLRDARGQDTMYIDDERLEEYRQQQNQSDPNFKPFVNILLYLLHQVL